MPPEEQATSAQVLGWGLSIPALASLLVAALQAQTKTEPRLTPRQPQAKFSPSSKRSGRFEPTKFELKLSPRQAQPQIQILTQARAAAAAE